VVAVVGLGNPGPRYARTRHNAGFLVLDRLAGQRAARFVPHSGTCSQLAQVRLADREIWLAKPQTFMNESGSAVAALLQHLGCGPADLLVVVDDVHLDLGRIRLRRGGSAGGHHGLASIIAAVQTEAVPRLRLGIGAPPPGTAMIEYVLSDFGPAENAEDVARRGAEAVEYWAAAGMEAAMNRFNGL